MAFKQGGPRVRVAGANDVVVGSEVDGGVVGSDVVGGSVPLLDVLFEGVMVAFVCAT